MEARPRYKMRLDRIIQRMEARPRYKMRLDRILQRMEARPMYKMRLDKRRKEGGQAREFDLWSVCWYSPSLRLTGHDNKVVEVV